MGKSAKGSRKEKKAWRANISTHDIDDYFIKATKDALTGGSLNSVPDDSLFVVDKSKEIPVKRKIEKYREKVLHYESVLQGNPFVKTIPSSTSKKAKWRKKKDVLPPTQSNGNKDAGNESDVGLPNIWDENDEDGNAREIRKPVAAHIPAVEVEPLGCSFNPPFEAHQDTLAEAVAIEMENSYKKKLGPQPIPTVDLAEPIEEKDKYFLDAEHEDEVMREDDDMVPLVDEEGNEIPPPERIMPEVVTSDGRYTHCDMDIMNHSQVVDVHGIFFAKSKAGIFILCSGILFLIMSFGILLFTKEQLNICMFCICLVGTIPIVLLKGKQVKKESVVILPTLGVQLEAHYWSGKVRRRFVSMGKILKPVLNECVTPVTCYWSLALVLRDENELMLVFENTRIPVKMLIPVWRALCAVIESKNEK